MKSSKAHTAIYLQSRFYICCFYPIQDDPEDIREELGEVFRSKKISAYWLFVLDLRALIGNEFDWREEADIHWINMGKWDDFLQKTGKETLWRKNWYESARNLKEEFKKYGVAKYLPRVARLPEFIKVHYVTRLTKKTEERNQRKSRGECVEDYEI